MKLSDYALILRPGAPVTDIQYLYGRQESLLQLHRSLNTPGIQPLVTGDRGIGKTSLVRCYISHHSSRYIWIDCSKNMTFEKMAQRVLSKAGTALAEIEQTQIRRSDGKGEMNFGLFKGNAGIQSEEQEKHRIASPDLSSPDLVLELISGIAKKENIMIVLDEFDRIPIGDFQDLFAELLKNLSNHHQDCNVKFLTIGIQSRATQLLAAHPSLERCARELYLSPIKNNDLEQFIDKVETDLGVKVEETVRRYLVQASGGFPYFIHLVLSKCVEMIIDSERTDKTIYYADYKKALESASSQAYRSHAARLVAFMSSPEGIEYKILNYLAIQKTLRIKTASILFEVRKHLDCDEKYAQRIVEEGIKNLLINGIIYLDRNDKVVGFIGPLVKLFIAENIRTSNRSDDPFQGHQKPLL